MLKVHVHKPLVLQFFLTNAYPHAVIEHVKVLYYVVRVDKLGRKAAPSFSEPTEPDKNAQPALETGVVTKGQFVADFKPDCRVGTRLKFQITEPGLYRPRASKRSALRAITNISRPSTWWPNERRIVLRRVTRQLVLRSVPLEPVA